LRPFSTIQRGIIRDYRRLLHDLALGGWKYVVGDYVDFLWFLWFTLSFPHTIGVGQERNCVAFSILLKGILTFLALFVQ